MLNKAANLVTDFKQISFQTFVVMNEVKNDIM